MKRSKIFLGVSTAILAVAGVAATKASKSPTLITRYYCTKVNKSVCVLTKELCTNLGSIICHKALGSNTYTLYTINANGTVNGCSTGTGKCIHPVKYVDEGQQEQ